MSDGEDDGDWNGGGDDGDDGDFDDGEGKKKKSPKKAKKDKGESKKKEKKKTEKKTSTKRKADSASPAVGGSAAAAGTPTKRVKADTPAATSSTAAAAASKPVSTGSVKERIVEVVSDSKAKPMILAYLIAQNRPYAYNQIWENLHRAVKKTSVPKLLDALEEEKKLQSHTFGKVKLFMAMQDPTLQIDQKEIDSMDEQITALQEKLAAEKSAVKALDDNIAAVMSTPTDSEADAQLAVLEKEVTAAAAKLHKLSAGGGAEVYTSAQVDQIQNSLNVAYARWKKFKRGVEDMIDRVMDGAPKSKKKKQVYEDCGVETDEEVGISIAKFLPLVKPVASTKSGSTPKLSGKSASLNGVSTPASATSAVAAPSAAGLASKAAPPSNSDEKDEPAPSDGGDGEDGGGAERDREAEHENGDERGGGEEPDPEAQRGGDEGEAAPMDD